VARVADIEKEALALAIKYEAGIFIVCVPDRGGLQVVLQANPAETAKMPSLLRHLADQMEQQHRLAGPQPSGRLM
jgi:hypothetical protein